MNDDPICDECKHPASKHYPTAISATCKEMDCHCNVTYDRIRLSTALGRLEEAKDRATKWANLAAEMLLELRQDYAPGALAELDGPKAVRKLRQKLERYRKALEPFAKLAADLPERSDECMLYDVDNDFEARLRVNDFHRAAAVLKES